MSRIVTVWFVEEPSCEAVLCEELAGNGAICIHDIGPRGGARAELVRGDIHHPRSCPLTVWALSTRPGSSPPPSASDIALRLGDGKLLARLCVDQLSYTGSELPRGYEILGVALRGCGNATLQHDVPSGLLGKIACIPSYPAEPGRVIREVRFEGCKTVELRLDLQPWSRTQAAELAETLKGMGLRVIVTLRDYREGGRYRGPDREKMDILLSMLDHGASLVDVEYRLGKLVDEAIASAPGRVIVSAHYFQGTPPVEALYSIAGDMLRRGAAVAKIVAYAESGWDVLRLMGLNVKWPGKAAAFAMGPAGGLSRALALLYGAALVYAPIGEAVAPGQLGFRQLVGLVKHLLGEHG